MRVLHYSHDTNGTGHIRKTLAVAAQVSLDFPQATQLLVTGTPQPRGTKLPHKLDFIKLPSIDKSQGRDQYPSLQLPNGIIKTLREKIILNAVRHFDPDVVFLDNASVEKQGEMFRSLNYLKHVRPETKLIAGKRSYEENMEARGELFPGKARLASQVLPSDSKYMNSHVLNAAA